MAPMVTPRSRDDGARHPRPASAAALTSERLSDQKASNSMENMIRAAHQHLVDDSPRSCSPTTQRRRRDNQQEGAQLQNVKSDVVKLTDHMDSFPLVPLPIIPQLNVVDLEQLEHGLKVLLGSLMPHESDQQLGRYATRQLGMVQQHLAQQRAQERVLQMLRGELPVTVVPIEAPTLRKSSSASAAVKMPTSSVSTSPDNQKSRRTLRPSSGSQFRAAPLQPSEAANLHWKRKKAGVEMARTMVQTQATKPISSTSFVISAGDNGSRKRRRPRVPAKRTPEEEAQYQAQQRERERENRRQAAYQRLLARRELQAKRKQKKKETSDESKVCKEENSESESEASEVSNCSESDEANEKAILALDVEIEPLVDEECEDSRSEQGESAGAEKIEEDEENDRCVAGESKSEAHECHSSRGLLFVSSKTEDHITEIEVERQQLPCPPSENGAPRVDAENNTQNVRNYERQVNDSKDVDEIEANQTDKSQDDATSFDLQHFIASRATAKLEQLQAEKEARNIAFPRPIFLPSTVPATICVDAGLNTGKSPTNSAFPRREANSPSDEGDDTEVLPTILTNENDEAGGNSLPESSIEPTPNEKQVSWIDDVRQSAVNSKINSPDLVKTLNLPRSPVAECKDYRVYFSNFHCILTSVFEQCRGTSSNTSSTSSLYHRPVNANGEHTMRLQQKLYESWQSIMQDYATVFGPRIVAPEGMVPVAAAQAWTPHYRINSTARKEVSEIVTEALNRLDDSWEEHPSGLGLKTTWNLFWTWRKPRVERQTLLAWQKVNHFQHAKALTRKDCLKKHIGKYIAAGGKLRQAFDIIPPTFLLPKEYVAFVQAFHERSERLRQSGFSEGKNIWIMKPVALSRGRGISLVNDLSQVIYGEQVVIQEYIAAPRLLDGFKFDLRLYVLVTSFNPLEAFLYDEGFVRLCTRPYEDSDLSNIFVHLTNSSIQKDNEDAIAGSANPIASAMKERSAGYTSKECDNSNEAAQKDTGGTKTTLAYLWRRLAAEGVNVEHVKRDIEEVVLKALLCGEDHIPFQVNSFDLLGYDILLDTDLRPWLIEINSSPSMARDNDLDYQVKDAMMLDTLRVVDPLHFDRVELAQVIARRQREWEAEKRRPHAHTRHPREAEVLATRQLNEDLTAILRGRVPRAYGEIPENIGNYKRICPHTTIYNQLVKLKRSCSRGGDHRSS